MQIRCSLNYITATTYWYPDNCPSLLDRSTSSLTPNIIFTTKQHIGSDSKQMTTTLKLTSVKIQKSSNITIRTSMTTAIVPTAENVSSPVINVTVFYPGLVMNSSQLQIANSSNSSALSRHEPPGSTMTLIYALTSVGALLLVAATSICAYHIFQKHSIRRSSSAQSRQLPEIPVVWHTDGDYCHIMLESELRPVDREGNDNDEYLCVTGDDYRSCRTGTYVTGAQLASNEELTCL